MLDSGPDTLILHLFICLGSIYSIPRPELVYAGRRKVKLYEPVVALGCKPRGRNRSFS